MIESLTDRIKTIRRRANEEIATHRKLQKAVHMLKKQGIDCDNIYLSCGRNYAFLTITGLELPNFEDENMDEIHEFFGKPTWNREVLESTVEYAADFFWNERTIYFKAITTPVEGICEIIKVPTGKKVPVTKTTVEYEDEYETVVNCAGD